MFEDDSDGNGVPCDHPIRWYHRLAAWAHNRIEQYPFLDRQVIHDRLPHWVCEGYERVMFDFPCWKCEADRDREYGATTKTDEDVIARWPRGPEDLEADDNWEDDPLA